MSFSDYLERRFDRRIRLFGSLLFVILEFFWMSISIYVPVLTFNQVTGIRIDTITPTVCIICTIYTCIGGIKAVIWTDVLQGVIMNGSVLLVTVKGTIDLGGLGVVYQRNLDSGRLVAPDWTFDPTVRMGFFAVLVGGTLLKLQGMCIAQPTVQRLMSLPNLKAIKHTLIITSIGLIFLLGLCIYLGLLAFAAYYDCDPITTKLASAKDQVIPLYVMQSAGQYPGVTGLFVSGVFSAALSSLSTSLNCLACIILKDFVEPFRTEPLSERQTAIVLRASVVIIGLASMGMVEVVKHLGMVMQLSSTFAAVSCGPLLGVFTIGMLLPFINSKSVFTGCSVAASIMAYIAVRAQFAIASGELQFPMKPVSVEGCTYNFTPDARYNSSIYENGSTSEASSKGIHHLSFLWYTGFGSAITLTVSLLATLYFGKQDTSEIDPDLVVPFVRRYMKPCKYDIITKYFEKRFSRRMRLFGATLFIFKAIVWMPIAVYVPALALNQVSGIGIHTITPVVIVICTFYTTVGGVRAVVWTDVTQSFIMFGSIFVLMIKGTYELGGFGVLWERSAAGGRLNAPDWTFDPTVRMSVLSVFVGGTFLKLQNTSINQPTIQRFMSLPSLAKIKQTLWLFSIGVTLLYACCIYIGLLTYATYYDCDPMSTGLAHARDQLVPLLVMRVLGFVPGLPGLFVSAVFSAALSSISTLLNSLAAVIFEDFVKPRAKEPLSERTVAIIMRSVVVVFGLGSIGLIFVVEKLGMVMTLSVTLQSILYGPMLGIFTVGMLMPWVNEKSVLTGSIVSFVCMAYICVRAQISNYTGSFRHPKLPVTVDGCDYEFDINRYLNSTSEYQPTQGSEIYHMSFLLYTTLGALISMIVSNVTCLIFGCNNIADVDEKLLAPFVPRLFNKKKYQSVKLMENISLNIKK